MIKLIEFSCLLLLPFLNAYPMNGNGFTGNNPNEMNSWKVGFGDQRGELRRPADYQQYPYDNGHQNSQFDNRYGGDLLNTDKQLEVNSNTKSNAIENDQTAGDYLPQAPTVGSQKVGGNQLLEEENLQTSNDSQVETTFLQNGNGYAAKSTLQGVHSSRTKEDFRGKHQSEDTSLTSAVSSNFNTDVLNELRSSTEKGLIPAGENTKYSRKKRPNESPVMGYPSSTEGRTTTTLTSFVNSFSADRSFTWPKANSLSSSDKAGDNNTMSNNNTQSETLLHFSKASEVDAIVNTNPLPATSQPSSDETGKVDAIFNTKSELVTSSQASFNKADEASAISNTKPLPETHPRFNSNRADEESVFTNANKTFDSSSTTTAPKGVFTTGTVLHNDDIVTAKTLRRAEADLEATTKAPPQSTRSSSKTVSSIASSSSSNVVANNEVRTPTPASEKLMIPESSTVLATLVKSTVVAVETKGRISSTIKADVVGGNEVFQPPDKEDGDVRTDSNEEKETPIEPDGNFEEEKEQIDGNQWPVDGNRLPEAEKKPVEKTKQPQIEEPRHLPVAPNGSIEEPENSHFILFLMAVVALVALFYMAYINRAKVMALVVEGWSGRSGSGRRYSSSSRNGYQYQPLATRPSGGDPSRQPLTADDDIDGESPAVMMSAPLGSSGSGRHSPANHDSVIVVDKNTLQAVKNYVY